MKIKNTTSEKEIYYKMRIYTDPIKDFSTLDIMELPQNHSMQLDTTRCTTAVSNIQVKVQNLNETVSSWIYESLQVLNVGGVTKNIYKNKVDIYAYIDGVGTLIYAGYLRNVTHDAYETWYNFDIGDVQELAKQTVFQNYLFKINGVAQSSITFPTLTGFSRPDPYDTIIFQGSPIDFVKGVFQLLEGKDWKEYLDWDGSNTSWDIANYPHLDGVVFYYEFTEALQNPRDWIQKNVLMPCNIFSYVKTDGKLYSKLNRNPLTTELLITVPAKTWASFVGGTFDSSTMSFDEIEEKSIINPDITLDDTNVISVNSKKIILTEIQNHIIIKAMNGTELYYYTNDDSIKKYGLSPLKAQEITFEGMNDYSGSRQTARESFIKTMSDIHFAKFANPSITLEIDAFYSTNDLFQVGGWAYVNISKLINWEGSLAGYRDDINPVLSANCVLDTSTWGNYTHELEDSLTGYFEATKVLKVDAVVKADFFKAVNYSVSSNETLIDNFLTDQGV